MTKYSYDVKCNNCGEKLNKGRLKDQAVIVNHRIICWGCMEKAEDRNKLTHYTVNAQMIIVDDDILTFDKDKKGGI